MSNIIPFPQKLGSDYFKITSASKPADVILMMTPDEPSYNETRLKILAAHYWGRS